MTSIEFATSRNERQVLGKIPPILIYNDLKDLFYGHTEFILHRHNNMY